MNYQITIVVDVETEEAAEYLLSLAKKVVIDNLNYEKQDYIAGYVKPE